MATTRIFLKCPRCTIGSIVDNGEETYCLNCAHRVRLKAIDEDLTLDLSLSGPVLCPLDKQPMVRAANLFTCKKCGAMWTIAAARLELAGTLLAPKEQVRLSV